MALKDYLEPITPRARYVQLAAGHQRLELGHVMDALLEDLWIQRSVRDRYLVRTVTFQGSCVMQATTLKVILGVLERLIQTKILAHVWGVQQDDMQQMQALVIVRGARQILSCTTFTILNWPTSIVCHATTWPNIHEMKEAKEIAMEIAIILRAHILKVTTFRKAPAIAELGILELRAWRALLENTNLL
jgi:hypothetical protein